MKSKFLNLYNENKQSIKTYSFCLLIGIIAGIILFMFLNANIKSQLKEEIIGVFDTAKDGKFETVNIIKNGIQINLALIVLIIFFSLTIITPILLCIMLLVKGISVGIYISTLILSLGTFQGIVATLLLVILPSVFSIATYIYISILSTNFYYNVVIDNCEGKIYKFIKYIYKIIISTPIIIFSIILEEIFAKVIISIYKG